MQALRFVMLLSLVVWIGGIIFFAAAVAPTVFAVLPTRQLAGQVVSRSLSILHWMGLGSGVMFLITSMLHSQMDAGFVHPFAARNLLLVMMIALTLISMFVISTKMLALRDDMAVIDNVPQNDPRRVEFNQLHRWSTRLEVGVLAIGIGVLWLTVRAIGGK